MTLLIEAKKVTKAYRGINAITDVDFEVRKGEIHALLGENGAGKSTLTKVIAGVVPPTNGTILLDGKEIRFDQPADGLAHGITMVFQETSLVPSMTVAQNLYLGDEKLFNRLRGLYIAAQQFFQGLNFNVDPWAMVSSLGAAQKQMVEIARAVRLKARVIIFDEPTATLTPEEKRHFFSLVKRLREDGVSIIFISHALEEALQLADRISIMRDGQLVTSGLREAFDREKIVQAMVGRSSGTASLHERKHTASRAPGRKTLSIQNLSWGSMVRNTSFSLYAGQITGIFGLIGSGRSETAKIISGVQKRNFFHGGEVLLDGRSVRYRVPREAVKDGIVYVTEDRKLEGFFETMSIADNIHASYLGADLNTSMLVRYSEVKALASEWTKKLNVRAIDNDASVIELSGGNQQKVVIAQALVQRPKVIIFDEPTRGVDVGAIAEIHQLIESLADAGMAIVVISSYLPEIMTLSDRILVSRLGRIVEEFSPQDVTEESVMYAAVH